MPTKTVMIEVTQKCNLDCVYCYEKYKADSHISFDTFFNIISYNLNLKDEYDNIEFVLHGGEPFYAFGVIRDVCELTWDLLWKKNYLFYTTTNGTLLTDEIKKWLIKNKERFSCSLSFDGTKEMQDTNRSCSSEKIDMDFFKQTWPGIPIKMTVSPKTLHTLSEGVIFLHELGFNIEDSFAEMGDWNESRDLPVLEKELTKLINYYLKDPYRKTSNFVNYPIMKISDERVRKTCRAGTDFIAYDLYGELSFCHLFTQVAVGETPVPLFSLECPIDDREECLCCPVFNACPFCYGVNFLMTNDPLIKDMTLCKFTKMCANATAVMYKMKIELYGPEILNFDRYKYSHFVNVLEKMYGVD